MICETIWKLLCMLNGECRQQGKRALYHSCCDNSITNLFVCCTRFISKINTSHGNRRFICLVGRHCLDISKKTNGNNASNALKLFVKRASIGNIIRWEHQIPSLDVNAKERYRYEAEGLGLEPVTIICIMSSRLIISL